MFVKKLCCTAVFATAMQSLYAGFGLETTRVIYNEADKSQAVVAFNTDDKGSYLTQSWIEDQNDKASSDFVVMSPLLKIRPAQKNSIQIVKNATFNPAQESLYWLNVKFIAPSPKDAENVLKYSMTHKIKVIYRPAALAKVVLDNEVQKMTWQLQNGQFCLNNPTPYYIHIAKLEIDGHKIEAPSYVAPNGQFKTQFNASIQPNSKLQLDYINDYGRAVVVQL